MTRRCLLGNCRHHKSSQAPKSLMDLSERLHNVQCDAKSPSSETPFNRKVVNVQLRMMVGFGVKAAVLVSQLFLCLCREEEQPGLSHLPGIALFLLAPSRCHGQTVGGNHRRLSLMSSPSPSKDRPGPADPSDPVQTDEHWGLWLLLRCLLYASSVPGGLGCRGR